MVPKELPFHLNNTLGALLIGGLVAAAFWGITSAQTYIYYQRYPNDLLGLKLIVALLWVLNTFDVFLTSHTLYHYLVTNHLDPLAVPIIVWSILIHIAVTSVTDAIIRSMLTQRVWKLSGQNFILTSIVGAIALCDLIIGLLITIKSFMLHPFAQFDRISALLYFNFGVGISGDLTVAIILCYYMFISTTVFQSSDTLLGTFNAYIVPTGLLTSFNAILGTIFYATNPQDLIFMGFYFNLAKMHINSYLALLNARAVPPKEGERRVSIRLSTLPDHSYISNFGLETLLSGRMNKTLHKELEVRVQTTVDHSISDATDEMLAYLATKKKGVTSV